MYIIEGVDECALQSGLCNTESIKDGRVPVHFSSAFNCFLSTICYQSTTAYIVPTLCHDSVTNKQETNDCVLFSIL